MPTESSNRLPKVSPNSMLARVLLAFLATAGFFYVNIMPALVDGLKVGLGFSNKQAGLVGSCNVYGAAGGAFLIVFLVRRINWRTAAHFFLLGLIGMDLLSMLFKNPFALMGARFLHGFIGGMLVGTSYSIFARTKAPDRTFGVLLLVQVFAGGLGVMSLPLLVPKFGTNILFVTLILFSLTTLVMLQFLPDYPVKAQAPRTPGAAPDRLQLKAAAARAVLRIFLSGCQHGPLRIHHRTRETLRIGCCLCQRNTRHRKLDRHAWRVIGNRGVHPLWDFQTHPRRHALTLVSTYIFNYSGVKWIWIAANVGTGITWNFVISHLLGMCARFDQTGQTAVWGGFASKMGLASGPMLFSFIVGTGNYSALIAMAMVLLAFATFASAIPAWVLDHGAMNDLPDAQRAQAVS